LSYCMSVKYKIRDQAKLYFVSFAVVYWIDVFSRRQYKDIFVESIRHCQDEKGLEVYGWCLMSNHAHMIMGTNDKPLEGILRDIKKYTSVRITAAIKANGQESRREWMIWMFSRAGKKNANNKSYQFWQQDNHPVELSTNEMMEQKLD